MTLVKLHACQYRKVKRFPDIGHRFTREGVLLRLRTAPPVQNWRLHVRMALRSGWRGRRELEPAASADRAALGSAARPRRCLLPNRLLGRQLPPHPPYANRTGSRIRLPGRLQALIRRLR